MRLAPRGLLWRTVLLLALLLIVAHLAWLQIFRVSQRERRARQAAQQIVSVVILTRAALINAQPGKRLELLRELSHREGIQVHLAQPDRPPDIRPPEKPLVRLIASQVSEQLGPDTRVAVQRTGAYDLWVSFRIDEDHYWVRLPRARIDRPEPREWIVLGALVLLLALAGAYLIVARINRPLRALARAAGDIGRGRSPAPVPESGAIEIATVAHAFNQMAADLQRTDAERALLLAGVSHDLRTPLSRIRLGVEMVEDKLDPGLKQGMVQDIEEIDTVINQFLDFARGAEAEDLDPACDLDALAERVCERYRRQGKPVTLHKGNRPPLPVRRLALERLIANLVNNALRHAKTPVEVRIGGDNAHATVAVLDRGPGIPPDEAERMLRPFTRLDSARSQTGSGLGLAIVERIARMHGGRVALLARAGGGLAAQVWLPLARK